MANITTSPKPTRNRIFAMPRIKCLSNPKLTSNPLVDKSSLWNGLNIEKRELYVKKKKFTRYGGTFSSRLGETGTKSFWSRIRVTKDRTFILASRQKGVFYPLLRADQPLAHPSEQDPLSAQLR
jgi:hypothetical protein